MVFQHISKDLKLQALWLRDQGFLSDDICYLLGFSQRSLSRWQTNMDLYGSAIPPHNPLLGFGTGNLQVLCISEQIIL